MNRIAANFLTRSFASCETIALLIRREDAPRPQQRIVTLEQVLAPRYMAWLNFENDNAQTSMSPPIRSTQVGFRTIESKQLMRIPRLAEGQHIELMGDTGAGKTRLIMQILMQIKERGHSAIVYDPACEFVQRFYDSKNGDIILNPLDARCPYWGPSEECAVAPRPRRLRPRSINQQRTRRASSY